MIIRIPLGMVNAFIIEEDGVVLIDTGSKNTSGKLMNYLMKHKYLEKIDLVILTHHHSDHVGGLSKLLDYRQIPVVMHQLDYQVMNSTIAEDVKAQTLFMKFLFLFRKNFTPIQVEPTILVNDFFDLSPYGVKGHLYHTPGHTKGSLSVVMGHDAIIGDLMMAFSGRPHRPIIAWDINILKDSVEKLLEKDIETFYFSHGKTYDAKAINKCLKKL